MGLLDRLFGGLTGSSASPMQSVLMNILAGRGQEAGNQETGGLGALVSRFEQAGLGPIAQSWISNGPNHPVTPQQLQGVFGEQNVQSMANQAGLDKHSFLSQLSQHLPNAVNGMTPNGQLPDEGTVSV